MKMQKKSARSIAYEHRLFIRLSFIGNGKDEGSL